MNEHQYSSVGFDHGSILIYTLPQGSRELSQLPSSAWQVVSSWTEKLQTSTSVDMAGRSNWPQSLSLWVWCRCLYRKQFYYDHVDSAKITGRPIVGQAQNHSNAAAFGLLDLPAPYWPLLLNWRPHSSSTNSASSYCYGSPLSHCFCCQDASCSTSAQSSSSYPNDFAL